MTSFDDFEGFTLASANHKPMDVAQYDEIAKRACAVGMTMAAYIESRRYWLGPFTPPDAGKE